jgi:hypothetical protein
MVLAISPTYHQRNSGRSRDETWAEVMEMAAEAKHDGVYLAVVLANTWHCHSPTFSCGSTCTRGAAVWKAPLNPQRVPFVPSTSA